MKRTSMQCVARRAQPLLRIYCVDVECAQSRDVMMAVSRLIHRPMHSLEHIGLKIGQLPQSRPNMSLEVYLDRLIAADVSAGG